MITRIYLAIRMIHMLKGKDEKARHSGKREQYEWSNEGVAVVSESSR